MKELNNKTKILIFLIAIIIVAGVVVILTKGLNFELNHQNSKRIEIYLKKQFEISDIKKITDEVMPDQDVVLQKVELYEDYLSIISNDITEEQKASIIDKINEKYGTEVSKDDIEIQTIPHTRGRDLLEPNIIPFVITTVIILIYIGIRYYKLGLVKVILKSILAFVVAQALLLIVMAITRIPIGKITITLVIAVYVLTCLGITSKFEKKLNENKQDEETNNA